MLWSIKDCFFCDVLKNVHRIQSGIKGQEQSPDAELRLGDVSFPGQSGEQFHAK